MPSFRIFLQHALCTFPFYKKPLIYTARLAQGPKLGDDMKNIIKLLFVLAVLASIPTSGMAFNKAKGEEDSSSGSSDSSANNYTSADESYSQETPQKSTVKYLDSPADQDASQDNSPPEAMSPPVLKPREKEYRAIEDKVSYENKVPPENKTGAPASDSDYFVTAGDVLQITVWKEEGLDREILVLPDGTITFPLIGTLQVQGLAPSAVQAAIKAKLKSLIPDASVTVMVKAPLGHTVSVLGQVSKPGEIVMTRHIGVMEALSQVGGLTPYANTSHIMVLRSVNGKKTSIQFPYDDIAVGQHLEKDIELRPGDVVVVPTAGLL